MVDPSTCRCRPVVVNVAATAIIAGIDWCVELVIRTHHCHHSIIRVRDPGVHFKAKKGRQFALPLGCELLTQR
jgi:hypothetical protein